MSACPPPHLEQYTLATHRANYCHAVVVGIVARPWTNHYLIFTEIQKDWERGLILRKAISPYGPEMKLLKMFAKSFAIMNHLQFYM
jgi:hypothetical protein